jgi:hypothetical protein
MTWCRARSAADQIVWLGHAQVSTAPFRASSVVLTHNRWVHSRTSERFIAAARATVEAVVEEYSLD